MARRVPRLDEGAAAGGEHDRLAARQQAGDDAALALAEMGLAVPAEDLADRGAGRLLDLGVGVAEGQTPARGQPAADGRLAGARHPHQHDGARGRRREIFGKGEVARHGRQR
jgi:hypothetical protein